MIAFAGVPTLVEAIFNEQVTTLLEDLKPIIDNLSQRICGMRDSLNIAQKEDQIFTLDVKMSDPSFWDDPDKAREISQEATQLKQAVEGYKKLVSDIEDAKLMVDMALEEGEVNMEGEISDFLKAIEETVEKQEILLLLGNTTAIMLSWPSMQGLVERKHKIGALCSSACICAGLRRLALA